MLLIWPVSTQNANYRLGHFCGGCVLRQRENIELWTISRPAKFHCFVYLWKLQIRFDAVCKRYFFSFIKKQCMSILTLQRLVQSKTTFFWARCVWWELTSWSTRRCEHCWWHSTSFFFTLDASTLWHHHCGRTPFTNILRTLYSIGFHINGNEWKITWIEWPLPQDCRHYPSIFIFAKCNTLPV